MENVQLSRLSQRHSAQLMNAMMRVTIWHALHIARRQTCSPLWVNTARACHHTQASPNSTPLTPLTPEQQELIQSMLRVDHAGEVGANVIYAGQLAVLGHDTESGPLIQVNAADQLEMTITLHFPSASTICRIL